MNKNTFGVICMIGGLAYLIVGIKFLISGDLSNDFINLLLSTIWSVGGICGIQGMLDERVTGNNRIVRVISYLPIVAFLLNIAGNIIQTIRPELRFNPLTIIALLSLVVGMLLVGIFTLYAEVWTGGRRIVPFLPALMPFIGMAIGSLLGIAGGVNVSLVAISWILIGYTVLTHVKSFEPRPVVA